ncbi:MAG: hypothetical protein IJ882_00815 [Paludibacteraceae bacterium]|nr:hypothetical protein [Paludibacteraceae bacterium]
MNNFTACYEYSIGNREQFDVSLLERIIPSCAGVVKTETEIDKQGVDYIATLKDGSSVTIDAKTRQPGARKYWSGEPELALEQYSVVQRKKVGWLFKRSPTHPDYILYTFAKEDTDKYYLIPFILLKKAAFENWKQWEQRFKIKYQPNESHGGYTSSALFVPASTLLSAVAEQMSGRC